MGDGLKRAFAAAAATRLPSKEKVTPSCGCVFCDVGLMPTKDGWHKSIWHRDVKCDVFNNSTSTR